MDKKYDHLLRLYTNAIVIIGELIDENAQLREDYEDMRDARDTLIIIAGRTPQEREDE